VRREIFTEDHDLFRQTARAFMATEIVPHRDEWERAGIVDRAMFRRAGEQGLLGMAIPERFGGGGVDDFRFNVVIGEEIMRADVMASGLGITLHNDVCLPYFLHLATPEQQERWLPGMATGDLMAAIAMTEPGAGSDLAGISTSAVRDGDHYIVNGAKTFITNGINADVVVVAVKTDPNQRHAGMSLMVVEAGMDGFTRGRNLDKVGMHAQDTAELFFADVAVPVDNLLGEEGKGFLHLVANLPQERLSLAVGALAHAEAAFGWTLEYIKERKAFGSSDRLVPGGETPDGRDGDRARHRPDLCGPAGDGAECGRAERRGRRQGQVVGHRAREARYRRLPADVRRLGIHGGVPDRPCLSRCQGADDLRWHHRDHEGDRGPVARPVRRTP
jgi:alkylation response protein AidB-like acyl-CoA dehydrogenase